MTTNRQAISVSVNDLRKLIVDLENELIDTSELLGTEVDYDIKFSVPIINKTPECSDTWEFEK